MIISSQYLTTVVSSYSNGREEGSVSNLSKMKNVSDVEKSACQGDSGHPLIIESDSDITGPETPGAQPLIPRLKRVQEDGCTFGFTTGTTADFSINNSKRVKFSQDLPAKNKKDEVASEMPMNNSKRVNFSHDLLSENKKDEVAFEMPMNNKKKCIFFS